MFMDMKYNEGTINRPEGDRVLDGPLVVSDINEYMRQLQEEPAWKKYDRNGITVFKSEKLAIVLTCLHENASIIDNTVDGLLTIQVIQGKVIVRLDDGHLDLKGGQIITIHPGIRHTVEAVTEAAILLTNVTD
jgi:quercetin dioxygenase-like cupin family protein